LSEAYNDLSIQMNINEFNIILSRYPLFQSKDYFAPTSGKFLDTPNENATAYVNRKKALFMYYKELTSLASKLESTNDNKEIMKIAVSIRDYTKNIPGSWDIKITEFPHYGQDIETLFFGGIVGMIDAVVALIVGLVVMIPAFFMGISYFGTPTYLLDTILAFINSFFMTLSIVLIPTALLYAKATTDSYDIMSKGHNLRMIDSLITLCKNELKPSGSETKDTESESDTLNSLTFNA
jgi:hypothetical protein